MRTNSFTKILFILAYLFSINILNTNILFSQTYLNLGIKQNYPEVKNTFAAFDVNGSMLLNLKKEDFVVKENGITRNVKSMSCNFITSQTPISSVLTIDVSGSMANGNGISRIDIVKKATSIWYRDMNLSIDECAITSFDHRSFINQDFTADTNDLSDAINALKPLGGTSYEEGFLGQNGGLTVIENSKLNTKRVMLFITDGESKIDTSAVIQKAKSSNTMIFTMTIGMGMPQSLKNIALATEGLYFENLQTVSDVVGVFAYISKLVRSQSGAGCEIVWETDKVCNTNVNLEILIPTYNIAYSTNYLRDASLIPNLLSNTTSLRYGEVIPGNTKDLTTNITAQGFDIKIDSFSISNKFTVTNWGGSAPPFTLTKGSSRTITVRFTPTDSNNIIGNLSIFNDGCKTLSFTLTGGKSGAIELEGERTLKIISPNGGEVYSSCDSLLIEWEGIAETDTVEIRYSTNNGQSWNLITEKHWGSNKYWWKHKGTVISDKILISVEQLGIMVYETNLIDAQNPTSVFKTIPHPSDTTKVLFGFWSYQNNYLYNFATKTFSKAGTIGAGSCYNKNGTENYWIWDRAINSHNTSDGSFKFGNVLPISMSSVTPDYYNNRVIVGDYFSGKLYILNETNFNLIDSLEFHDSAPFEYNFSKDKKRMISSAQNEAIIWDMTTYDTLKIFRNTGGFAYYFNVKDEDKIHYIKDNKMNTYSLSTGNVTSYNIKISNKNYGYATTMATMADGENIIFVELIGGIEEDFYLSRDFEGYQVYKTNINTQTSTLLFGNKGSSAFTYYYVTKSHTSNEAYINSTSGRPRFYRYNNVSNTYDSLNVFADIYAHPGIFNLGYDASSIYSYGGWDTYLQKIDRKTNKLIKEYGPVRSLPNIAVYDSGKKINWGGWYYFNVIDSSMNFIERRTESGFEANHNQNLGKIKNNLTFIPGTNKMQSRIDINTVEHTYYLDFNYAGNHAITTLKDGTIVVVSSENTEKFTDIYFFKEGVSTPILSKRLDRYTRIEKVFAGGDFIAIRIENEDFGKVFEIYDLELNILKQFKDVNTTNNYFGISSNGKYIYKYVDDKNVRVERIDNGKIMKNYNFTGNSAIHSTSLNLSDDLNYAGFYINDDTQVEGKKQRLGIFYLGIPYLQADTSDAVFEIAKPKLDRTNPLNIGTIAVGKHQDTTFNSVICNNSKFAVKLDSLYMKSGLKIKLLTNLDNLTIEPGECINLEFNYSPTIVENVSDTLITRIGCDTLKILVLANSAAPNIQVVNNIIDFKNVAVDKTKDTINAITIKNTGTASISINNVTIEGPDKTQFSILSGGGSFTLPAGQEHKMNFKFSPKKVGRTNTRIEFTYNGLGSPAEVLLLGNGFGSPKAVFRDATVFDTLKCGKLSQDTLITIKNTGSANLILNNFTFTPNNHFFISDIVFPNTIGIGDSVTFKLKYEPSVSGKHTSILKINSNDTINYNKGDLIFNLSGVKDSVNITFDKTILDFGITQFPKTEQITVTNNGSVDLNVNDIQFDQAQFKILAPLPPFVVGVGKSESLTIEFTPIDTFSVVGRITLIGEPCTVLQANLLGGGGTPILQVQDEFAFDPNNCNDKYISSKVYLWNMGNLDLNIDSIYIDGVDKDEFEVVYPLNKITIAPRKNDSVIVSFKNRVFEERTAKLNIKSNSVTGELSEIELKARKYQLSLKSNLDILDFGVTQVTKIDSFYVYNDGELEYTLSEQTIDKPQFKIIEPILPYELKVGDSVWVKVEFTPEDTLSIVSDLTLSSADCPNITISLLGGSGTPRIRTIELLEINQNTCAPQDTSIVIEYWNMGNLPLEVNEIKLMGANADQFRININFQGTEIVEARNKSSFELLFKSGANGRYLAQIVLVTNSVEGDKFINVIAERKGIDIEAFGFTDINNNIIDFGITSTPVTKSFYLNNKGTTALEFNKVEISNPKFEILEPNLPFVLLPNIITEVKVRYNSTNEESEVGLLKILGSVCGEIMVDLVSGYNTPTLRNTPEKIDFSLNGCDAGDYRDSTIYLWNLGNADLNISKVSIIGQNANQFRILYPTQELTLASKVKDSIVVRYLPTINGISNAKIQIENNSQNPNIEINLTGSKLKGELKYNPTVLDFGVTQTPITLKTEVENIGDYDITINYYSINKPQFTVANLATPLVLKPKEIITLFIEFSPSDTNSVVAKLNLNTGNCGIVTLNLLGGGGTPVIQTLDKVEFNAINCSGNNAIDTTFEIWNMGTLPLIISNISIKENGSGDASKFEVISPLNTITILPRLSSTITLRYLNNEIGSFSTKLLIESNSVDGDLVIPITANSLNSSIIVDRTTVDYGIVQTSKRDKITITNDGNVSITINQFNIKGVDTNSDGVFYVENISTPFVLLPNQSQELIIVFNPNDTLSKMANLTLDVSPCGNIDVVLLGGGGTPNIQSIKTLDFAINSCDDQKDVKRFTLWNMGALNLEISEINLENNTSEFKINLPTAPITVGARSQIEFEVEFYSIQEGTFTDNIIIKSNSTEGDYIINLSGQKFDNSITLDKNDVNFGSIGTPPFDTKESVILITNNTETNQTIYEPILGDSRFRLLSPKFPIVLKSLETVEIRLLAISNFVDTTKNVSTTIRIRTENCGELTANLRYSRANGSAEFVIGKAEEVPNREINIPITLVQGTNLNNPLLEYFEFEIEFNATMLYPLSMSEGQIVNYTINGNIGKLKLQFPPKKEINSVVTNIRFKTLLGNDTISGLKALDYLSVGEDIAVSVVDGEFSSMGICYADGARLINPYGIINLGIARPNPVQNLAFVDVELIEKDFTKITLYNNTGLKIQTLFAGIPEKGIRTFSIDAKDLSSGVYYIILETPTYTQTSKFEIVK